MLKNRRSIRLKGYDYSQSGAYFITICLHNRIDLFGSIVIPEPVGAGLVPALMDNDIHENTYGAMEPVFGGAVEQSSGATIGQKSGITMGQASGAIIGQAQGLPLREGWKSSPLMRLNEIGRMVVDQWQALSNRFDGIGVHEFVLMPDHIHGIVEIERLDCQNKVTLADIVGAFKSLTTHAYIQGVHQVSWRAFEKRLWQRNYWEHIIRNEQEYQAIVQYIRDNPLRRHHHQQ